MIIPILILTVILLLGLGCGAVFWFVLRHRQPTKEITTAETLPFRWSYIILPLAILALAIILTAYFYHQLTAEVAYHFKLDGSPDRWLGRGMIAIWFLLPQLLLTLVAVAITWGITKLGVLFRQPESAWVKPERILLPMGNMVALPQTILCFAMVDIFSYNAYQIHIMPLWVFALIIMGLGGIILGIFFILAIRRAWRAT
ncbi:MAG: DUF1648 domain-containing protein [Dehalococcoidales bacterium]